MKRKPGLKTQVAGVNHSHSRSFLRQVVLGIELALYKVLHRDINDDPCLVQIIDVIQQCEAVAPQIHCQLTQAETIRTLTQDFDNLFFHLNHFLSFLYLNYNIEKGVCQPLFYLCRIISHRM